MESLRLLFSLNGIQTTQVRVGVLGLEIDVCNWDILNTLCDEWVMMMIHS